MITRKKLNHKRILIISWEMYPIYAGGLGVLVNDLVGEMLAQGSDVTVVMPHKKTVNCISQTVSLFQKNRKFYKLKSLVPNLKFGVDYFRASNRNPLIVSPELFSGGAIKPKPILYPNHTPLLTQAFAFAVQEYLTENTGFDLIIGMDWMAIATFKLLQDAKNTIPFWFYVNSTEFDRTAESKFSVTARSIMELESAYFKLAEKVVAISSLTKDILVNQYGVPESKTQVVLNHVTFSPYINGFPELDKGKNVLFIGRLAAQKGLSFLLDTAEKVLSFDSNAKFIIAGDGELLGDTVTSVCERKLENNVLFTGWVNSEQKKQLYRSSDLFVMSSPSEPFGLTPLEAVLSGVPVISSKKCGFLGVLPSTPVFDYHDTHAFADLILYYLQNPEIALQLIKTQQSELSKHSWKEQVKSILYEVK